MTTPATSREPRPRSKRRIEHLRRVRRARRLVFAQHFPFPHLDYGDEWVLTFTWSVQ